MGLRQYFKLMLFFLPGLCLTTVAQEGEGNEEVNTPPKGSRFQVGLFAGGYIANDYTAALYDGYGYDFNGNKNSFANSFMYRKIVFEFGGQNGLPDQIAQSLNVNHNDWSFSQNDMPVNMRYNITLMMGLQTRFCIDKRNSILLNINASRLTVNGEFTIIITAPNINPQLPGYVNLRTFSIIGGEQRLLIQAGYQRLLGDNEQINLLAEAGASISFAKFDKNQIMINNLTIDLTTFYNQQGYAVYQARNLTGIGGGIFGGFGVDVNGTKLDMQLLYIPSFDRISIGENPKLTLQHAFGLRAYYKI